MLIHSLFYGQIPTQNDLFELTNAKKTRVFMFVMCRYGYYEKRTKQSKNGHESMKRIAKVGAGKVIFRNSS